MPLDVYTKAELRRSALGYVQRETASEDVPARIRELRQNIARLDGRSGRPVETMEENKFELEMLEKLALAMDVPTEAKGQAQPEEEDE